MRLIFFSLLYLSHIPFTNIFPSYYPFTFFTALPLLDSSCSHLASSAFSTGTSNKELLNECRPNITKSFSGFFTESAWLMGFFCLKIKIFSTFVSYQGSLTHRKQLTRDCMYRSSLNSAFFHGNYPKSTRLHFIE